MTFTWFLTSWKGNMRLLCTISSWKWDVFFNKKILKKTPVKNYRFSKTQMENKNTWGENWILLVTSSFSLLPSFGSATMLKSQLLLTCPWSPHEILTSFWQPHQVTLKAATFLGNILFHKQPIWKKQQICNWKNKFMTPRPYSQDIKVQKLILQV